MKSPREAIEKLFVTRIHINHQIMVLTNQDSSLTNQSREENLEKGIRDGVGQEEEEEEDRHRELTKLNEEEEVDVHTEEAAITNKSDDSHSTCSSSSSHTSDSTSDSLESSSSSSTSSSSSASNNPPSSLESPTSITSTSNSSTSSSSTKDEGEIVPPKDNSSSSIQLEDNDKNYTVLEPTKPKTWLEYFNSFSPRTRQTVRTAAIALISAVALVAIFHLAKLAEHPVSSNSIDESPLQGDPARAPIENEAFLKSQTGKAYRQPGDVDDWRGGEQFAQAILSAGGQNPVAPIQDMLARAGKNARIHPILGVPVASDFLDRDIDRINRLDRSRARPANSTEIEKTLDLVRHRVESDRKKLTSKTLRLWSPGDAPLRVLLVTTWRSGSTFLGQVLANHPAVFHHYEPLSPRGILQIRSGREAFQAQQLLHRLLDCRYSGLDEYLNYTRNHPEDMLGHNIPVWEACKRGPNTNACYNATFLSQSCQLFPIQLVKTVRLRLNLTQLFLNDEKMNVKVVFLVRDPRAVMSSRYSSVSWCTDKPDCSSPEVLCSDMQGDLKVATALEKLYPDRFIKVKYEDIASNPHDEIQHLMEFLGMEYSPSMATYVEQHTQRDQESPWSTKRKSVDRVTMWKKQLPLQEVHVIQNACDSVLKSLNYELVGQ